MTGDQAIARRPLLLVSAMAGLVLVVMGDTWLVTVAGVPVLALTTGYVAAWVARLGAAIAWWGVPAVVVVLLADYADTSHTWIVGVLAVLAGVGLGIFLRLLQVTMRHPLDPSAIAAASLLAGTIVAIGHQLFGHTASAVGGHFGATVAATTLGSLIVLPAALAYRPGLTLAHAPELIAGVTVIAVVATLAAPRVIGVYVSADIGVAAWLVLPLVLLVGWRYGVFIASLTLFVLGLAAATAIVLAGPSAALLRPERAVVGGLLAIVSLSIVLLLRRQRSALSRLRRARDFNSAFLRSVQPMWYIKAFDSEGSGRYIQLGGGPYRDRAGVTDVTDEEIFGADIAAQIAEVDRDVMSSGVGRVVTEILPMPDGSTVTVLSDRFPIRDGSGRVVAMGGVRTDITEREALAERERVQSVLANAMFERSPVPTLRISRTGDRLLIAAANEAFARVTGRSSPDLVGSDLASCVPHQELTALRRLFISRSRGWSPQAELHMHTRIGGDRLVIITVSPLDDSQGQQADFVVHVEDVTARRAAEEAVAWNSLFDSATGLLNRSALNDRMDAAMHRLTASADGGMALVVLDVDDFRTVNDAHGHSAGDSVLGEIGRRLSGNCGPDAAVARLSADEFAVLVEGQDRDSVAVLVGRLQSVLAQPIDSGDISLALSTSFGVAVTASADTNSSEFMRRAELALFRAKRSGRGRVEFYAESLRSQAAAHLNVRSELARALAGDSLEVAYQPIVDLSDGSVRSYEALVRLVTDDGRLLPPAEFLSIARDADMVTQINRQMLGKALRDRGAGRLPVPHAAVSVNLESRDLQNSDFAVSVLSELHTHSVQPGSLIFEVTEATLLAHDSDVMRNIASLREAGVTFAIDDFGTGYSSLAQWRQLAADIVKIDRSFTVAMTEDPEAGNMIATIVQLARTLGLTVVAEGIETRDQAQALLRIGCQRGQGYLFGRPAVLSAQIPRPATADRPDLSSGPTPLRAPGTDGR